MSIKVDYRVPISVGGLHGVYRSAYEYDNLQMERDYNAYGRSELHRIIYMYVYIYIHNIK